MELRYYPLAGVIGLRWQLGPDSGATGTYNTPIRLAGSVLNFGRLLIITTLASAGNLASIRFQTSSGQTISDPRVINTIATNQVSLNTANLQRPNLNDTMQLVIDVEPITAGVFIAAFGIQTWVER